MKGANDVGQGPEVVRALDARYYTDPDVFDIEKRGLLAETWQYAGHVSQLEKPGDYFTFEIAGESLFCCLLYTSPSPRDS